MIECDLLCRFLLERVEEFDDVCAVLSKFVRRSVTTDNEVPRHRVALDRNFEKIQPNSVSFKATYGVRCGG